MVVALVESELWKEDKRKGGERGRKEEGRKDGREKEREGSGKGEEDGRLRSEGDLSIPFVIFPSYYLLIKH